MNEPKVKYPKLTYQILAYTALNRDVAEIWIDWALDMVTRGHESEHLIVLAGISKPYNQFYLQELTSKVFDELSLDYSYKEIALRNYSAFLASEVLASKRGFREVLNELNDICIELDYERYLFDFYLLFYAMEDLEYSENQWYWPNATRANIKSIITEYFQNWVRLQEKYFCPLIEQ